MSMNSVSVVRFGVYHNSTGVTCRRHAISALILIARAARSRKRFASLSA